jgi:hypothetical protein
LFEGFHHGVPATWQTIGSAATAGDFVSLTTVAGNHTAIVPPIPTMANGTITAGLIVDTNVDVVVGAETTVTMPYSPTDDQGIFCELAAPPPSSGVARYVSLWDSPQQKERGSKNFQWSPATQYRVALSRTGNNYACAVTPSGGQPQTANGLTGSPTAESKVAIAVYGANARAAFLLVVSSP